MAGWAPPPSRTFLSPSVKIVRKSKDLIYAENLKKGLPIEESGVLTPIEESGVFAPIEESGVFAPIEESGVFQNPKNMKK